ncbi:DUF4843 domain-containing protein [Chitinophaga vietnamensis]|uniref:DUF4843 domain-containing protein n=1 Tax=Chitinophaga vietnamensis TaxID=2593957 RepID=UPI0011784A83|nr:DUF4843 domain-containing protein [Chitinophaga vietnamensis]
MNRNKPLFFSLLLLLLGSACTKSNLLSYQGSTDIYFSYRDNYQNTDTIHYSFARDTLTTDTLKIYAKVIGEVAAVDRSFSMVTVDSATTAVAGQHYRLPVADSLMIPAGAVSRLIPVVVLRPAALYEKSVTLTLKLVPNNYFKTNMQAYDYKAPYVASAVVMKIVIDDILPQPGLWDANKDALGAYSRLKLELMVKVMLLKLQRFYNAPVYSPTQLTSFSRQVQQYLNQQQQAGYPVKEADGSNMKMGPAVQ